MADSNDAQIVDANPKDWSKFGEIPKIPKSQDY